MHRDLIHWAQRHQIHWSERQERTPEVAVLKAEDLEAEGLEVWVDVSQRVADQLPAARRA